MASRAKYFQLHFTSLMCAVHCVRLFHLVAGKLKRCNDGGQYSLEDQNRCIPSLRLHFQQNILEYSWRANGELRAMCDLFVTGHLGQPSKVYSMHFSRLPMTHLAYFSLVLVSIHFPNQQQHLLNTIPSETIAILHKILQRCNTLTFRIFCGAVFKVSGTLSMNAFSTSDDADNPQSAAIENSTTNAFMIVSSWICFYASCVLHFEKGL